MKVIKTIDLWTEPFDNYYECFNGAFIDGMKEENLSYDSYKVVFNCNCIITSNSNNLVIGNKHNAIVFYKNNNPVRLAVLNKNTNVESCIEKALEQRLNGKVLNEYLSQNNVKGKTVNLNEQHVFNEFNLGEHKELDVCSCDRLSLLKSMLKGSFTENGTCFVNLQDNDYSFNFNVEVNYKLETDCESFSIMHKGAFINKSNTRIIIIQNDSTLGSKDIKNFLNSL